MPKYSNQSLTMLTNASATGGTFGFEGGRAAYQVVAGTGGATIGLDILGPNSTWIPITAANGTVNACVILDLPAGTYRASVTGGTTPSGIHAKLVGFSL